MREGRENLRFLANKLLYLSNDARLGLLIANKKSYTGFRLSPNSMTLNDLERQNRGFRAYGFLAILGCETHFKSELRQNQLR